MPGTGDADFLTQLNPASLEVLRGCKVEPSLAAAGAGTGFQFERLGYFCVDPTPRPATPCSITVTQGQLGEDRDRA